MFSFFDNENVSGLRDRWTSSKHAEHIEHAVTRFLTDLISHISTVAFVGLWFCHFVRVLQMIDGNAKRIFSPVVYSPHQKWSLFWTRARSQLWLDMKQPKPIECWIGLTVERKNPALVKNLDHTKSDTCLQHTSCLSQFKVDPWCLNLFQRPWKDSLVSLLAWCPPLFIW